MEQDAPAVAGDDPGRHEAVREGAVVMGLPAEAAQRVLRQGGDSCEV
jgi:hypothetical protein